MGSKQTYRSRKATQTCTKCGLSPSILGYIRCIKCNQEHNAASVKRSKEKREKIFEHYGGYTCVCCGLTKEPEFMQLDHKYGSGNLQLPCGLLIHRLQGIGEDVEENLVELARIALD